MRRNSIRYLNSVTAIAVLPYNANKMMVMMMMFMITFYDIKYGNMRVKGVAP